MFLRKEFDRRTGIYRSKDSIEHLKFRVTLKKLNSLIKVPKFATISNVNAASDTIHSQINEDETDELESHNIQWQEKRLSLNEIDFYSTIENCKTDIQKKYHQIIKINGLHLVDVDETKVFDKIFTYIPDDCFVPSVDTINANKEFNLENNDKIGENPKSNFQLNQNSNSPAVLVQQRDSNVDEEWDTMYIMASLIDTVDTILCQIKWKASDGLLIIYPDFNDIQTNPYLIEIQSDCRHMYQYSIENLSKTLPTNDWHSKQQQQQDLQIISKLSELTINAQPSMFNLPPRRCTNIYLFLEIVSAEDFEYDNIHVRYRVIVPDRCEIIEDTNEIDAPAGNTSDMKLYVGSTHSSYKSSSIDGQWYFGFCYELCILCKDDYKFEEHLKITYEIISIDGWQRERIEGYATQVIPFQSGCFSERLSCFRDIGCNSLVDRLERYFIGGRRKFDLEAFQGINSGEATKLNRYGNQTKSTGFLNVSNQIVVQKNLNFFDTKHTSDLMVTATASASKNLIGSQAKRSASSSSAPVTEATKTHTNLITIDDVVSAYQKAKERLEATTSLL